MVPYGACDLLTKSVAAAAIHIADVMRHIHTVC